MNREEFIYMEGYEAPQVEVVEVEIERGFAVSATVMDYDEGGSLGNYITE